MKEINEGIKGVAETVADVRKLAVNMKSGNLEVFATPAMVALMEEAACNCLAAYLEDDETTVGTELSIKHISATPENMKVFAEATLIEINGREFVFEVVAKDEKSIIGTGRHSRFLVFGKKFTEKTKNK